MQRSRYATYFDVAVLRCLLQPHWTEEGVHWALTFYLQRLRQILEEKPERPAELHATPLPRPRSSSMVAAAPSLVNTHKTQVTGAMGGQGEAGLLQPGLLLSRCTHFITSF